MGSNWNRGEENVTSPRIAPAAERKDVDDRRAPFFASHRFSISKYIFIMVSEGGYGGASDTTQNVEGGEAVIHPVPAVPATKQQHTPLRS